MKPNWLADFALLADGGAYGAGQIAGVVFMVILAGAILLKFVKK